MTSLTIYDNELSTCTSNSSSVNVEQYTFVKFSYNDNKKDNWATKDCCYSFISILFKNYLILMFNSSLPYTGMHSGVATATVTLETPGIILTIRGQVPSPRLGYKVDSGVGLRSTLA